MPQLIQTHDIKRMFPKESMRQLNEMIRDNYIIMHPYFMVSHILQETDSNANQVIFDEIQNMDIDIIHEFHTFHTEDEKSLSSIMAFSDDTVKIPFLGIAPIDAFWKTQFIDEYGNAAVEFLEEHDAEEDHISFLGVQLYDGSIDKPMFTLERSDEDITHIGKVDLDDPDLLILCIERKQKTGEVVITSIKAPDYIKKHL